MDMERGCYQATSNDVCKHAAHCPSKLSKLLPLLLLIAATSVSCSPSPKRYSDEHIKFLASDAHVIVADTPLVLPYIALGGFSGDASFSLDKKRDRDAAKNRLNVFRAAADNPQTAPTLGKLEINITTYGWDDFGGDLIRICSHLKREWSKSVCDNPWAPLKQALPGRIYLADIRRLDAFDNHLLAGGGRMSDLLKSMHIESEETTIGCDHNADMCYAATNISANLFAIWYVGSSKLDRSSDVDRESKSIKAFVHYALGPKENFNALFIAACQLRRPDSPRGPDAYHVSCEGS